MNNNEYQVKPIDVLIELAKEYFSSNEESNIFELSKAHLGSKLGVGINKQGRICMALVGEYPFIKDGKGFLTVERQGFKEWLKLAEQRKSQEERRKSINEEYPALMEEIKDWESKLENAERNMAGFRETRDKLKARFDELTKEKESVPKETEELKGKLLRVRAEIEEGKRQGSDLTSEISKNDIELKKIEELNLKKIEAIKVQQKEKSKPLEQILNENNAKLRAELDEIKSHPIYTDYLHEKSTSWKVFKEVSKFLIYGLIFYISITLYSSYLL